MQVNGPAKTDPPRRKQSRALNGKFKAWKTCAVKRYFLLRSCADERGSQADPPPAARCPFLPPSADRPPLQKLPAARLFAQMTSSSSAPALQLALSRLAVKVRVNAKLHPTKQLFSDSFFVCCSL